LTPRHGACIVLDMSNYIATAQVTDKLAISIELFDSGFYGVISHYSDGTSPIWDGKVYLTSAEARKAANRLWLYIRNAEKAKVAA